MLIRDGRATDLHDIWQIHEEARENGETHGLDYGPADFRDVLFSARHRCLVAAEGDAVHGFLLAYDHATWGYVDMIVVRRRFRQQGLATALVRHLIADPRHWRSIEMCHEPDAVGPDRFCTELGFTKHETFVWRIKEIDDRG